VYTRIDYLRTGELFGNIYVPPVHLEAPLSIPSPSPRIWRQAPPSSAPHPHLYIVVLYVIRVQAVCVELTMPLPPGDRTRVPSRASGTIVYANTHVTVY